ncbi:hypothetical protein AYL99_05536 [Fonsecaea erecta]|uniref:Fungal N-terminal domain-containing protein n=1 Tax=Fonsecaea erecta TaxID=1367422 RepID=A0A178ZL63_9EURO|nr:hypothetical protein AYL99_05536 [Fonsecaea erecta]OAP60534.1 hypothetical protein AYL99_05536 [Fonsecaea erecta]
MNGNPWSAVTAGVSSGLTFVFKICEVTYALRAVDQQTREYLITAQHAWTNIKTCRELLSHQQDLLPLSERKDYERVMEETKRAAEEVALLLEPARVDLDADCRIHFSTRVMWVLSDNSNVSAALKRLDIVHTTLTQNISTLRLLRSCGTTVLEPVRTRERPPSYNTSQLLQWKYMSRLSPKHSTENLCTRRSDLRDSRPPETAPAIKELPPEMPADVPAQFIRNVSGQWSPSSELSPNPVRSETSTLVEVPCGDGPAAVIRPTAAATGSTHGSTNATVEDVPRTWLEHQAMKSRD